MYLPDANRYQRMQYRRCGASRPEQITDNLRALSAPPLTAEELNAIDAALR